MDIQAQAHALVSEMTLAEKASLLSGADNWHTKSISRLGLQSVAVSDGPHGLRKETADANGGKYTVPATCFPTAAALACSFDRSLLRRVGAALATEARANGVAVLLGPGLNIKRSPLCGRNFEYFSEDPVVSGELAGAYIAGVQGEHVGTSMKHFALNNQELRRLTVDAVADERAMFEIYLSGFERALQIEQPWTVMCSYNRVKGVNASDNEWLLTDVLRTKFGFRGLVMSDWGAVNDRVTGVSAGLDLEMPFVGSYHDQLVEKAVRTGALPEAAVDQCAARVVELALKTQDAAPCAFDEAAHRALAREAAYSSAVLLKNNQNLLPLKAGARVAVLGAFAKTPRYQGSGSSKVVPLHLDCPLDELVKLGLRAEFAEGYREASDHPDEALLREACEVARSADAALLFIGLPDRFESEGFDREELFLPESHVELVRRVHAVNSNVVVVLSGGSVMDLSWEADAKAILLMYLGGQSVGGAVADLILGKVYPSGKLAESWPFRLEDVPSYAYFPGYPRTVEYRESIFVGYRYYDTAKMSVRYPFGYGLSYTSFSYGNLQISGNTMNVGETLRVSCDVTNSGRRAGSETVQLYVSHRSRVLFTAEQELKGFEKVFLNPGETKTVSFLLSRRDLCYYDAVASDWRVEGGSYEIRLSASCRDIRLKTVIEAEADEDRHRPDLRASAPCYYDLSNGMHVPDDSFAAVLGRPIPPRERQKGEPHTLNATLEETQDSLFGRLLVFVGRRIAKRMANTDEVGSEIVEHVLFTSPLRMMSMEGGGVPPRIIEGLVLILNHHLFQGIRHMLTERS
ncbi:MAG: glycoside hydrolase family 3 C-terminal domain-containing protein [Eubacteriales bacterium]|nr:glycoside hydrolase family 3 C-terminal domain-containing protein [Eubacteriales bacterium]